MGAWGHGSFENDAALDWVQMLVEGDDLAPVEQAFDELEEVGADYLDVDIGSAVIAACEVLARCQKRPGARYDAVDEWVKANPQALHLGIIRRGLLAIDRVLGPQSELASLWDGNAAWRRGVEDLRRRVVGP